MINPSDFAPLIAHPALAPAVAPRSPTAGAAAATSPSAWFDAGAVSGETSISASLNPASRGLSVDQHAERVLGHLLGEREGGV